MKPETRNLFRRWHRDIAYFYVGLILSFSISGIALNHRRTFNSRSYVVETELFNLQVPQDEDQIDETYVKSILPTIGIENEYRSFRISNGALRVLYDHAQAEIDIKTGEGEKEWLNKRILLAEMADLHQTTNKWWIWYSDIFGVGMILIATSGMFIAGGNQSFRKKGWIMALVGLIFPLIFLLLII